MPNYRVLIASSMLLLAVGPACDSGPKPNADAASGSAEGAAANAKAPDQADAAKPDAAKPDAAKPDAAKPDAAEPEASKPAKPAPAKPATDEAARLRKQLTTLLNEGRALTKKEDYAGGMAKYQEALKIDASDVSVLGELGWAAFKAGDLELAHRTTVQALKHVRDDNRRGMLLYNLGRVEEQRERWDVAIEHYEASLKARPNKTVEDRLKALREQLDAMAVAGSAEGAVAAVQDPPPASAGLEPLGRDLADLAAACKLVETQRCEDFTLAVDEPCACAPTLVAAPSDDGSWGLLQLGQVDQNMQVAWFPVVQTDAGWTVFSEVLYSYNPGAFGIYEEVTLQPTSVTGGGADAILQLRASKTRSDSDMGLNEVESEDLDVLVLCTRAGGVAQCSKALLTSYMYVREVLFPGEDEEVAGEQLEHEGLPVRDGFRQTAELRDGKLVVTRTETVGEFDVVGDLWGALGWVLEAGEYPVAELTRAAE